MSYQLMAGTHKTGAQFQLTSSTACATVSVPRFTSRHPMQPMAKVTFEVESAFAHRKILPRAEPLQPTCQQSSRPQILGSVTQQGCASLVHKVPPTYALLWLRPPTVQPASQLCTRLVYYRCSTTHLFDHRFFGLLLQALCKWILTSKLPWSEETYIYQQNG